ncbi:MAG: RNB domain-containing ribonuclease, partial [Alphaproteobacteria bacterium]|nr:RNB domain-containing ribonuclease [Alphaproteobacteria bacterium]
MARTPRNSKPFPTRDAVLTFIRESTTPVGKREIARAFQITGSDRIPLKAMLRELKAEGLFDGGKSRYASERGRVPNVCVLEVTDIDGDGELIARPVRWESDTAPPPIYLSPQAPGIGALGVGDRVLARTKKTAAGFEAETIRVLEGGRQQVIGVFSLDADGGRIEPTDRRAKRDFRVSREYTKGAKAGEIVVAETVAGRHLGLPEARIVERIGKSDEPASISLLAIHSHGIPTTFPEDALAEAAAATAPNLGKRVDLRAVPLVTIDGADARDFDDAVFAEPDSDKKNSGGWHLIVAIADVAHFVRPGSSLDNEAVERGNSTYFPDRVVPMLPEALSNGLCSLKPNEDRACLAAHLYIDSAGTLVRHRFERAL